MSNNKLLITGGTGSFGNAYLNRVLNNDKFSEIFIFSRDEKKQDDLRKKLNDDRVKFFIGDVRDVNSVNQVVKNVDYIFHAAALKQVPSCEFFPLEAVKTNILGTENVLNAAEIYDIKKAVILSTDKAAYPINAMGMSKALMEKVMIAKSRMLNNNKSIFCGTRYGNVMGSRGSVIPLFISQIKNNKDLTITDSNMTRFMMSLDDAVDLVDYAFENANQGDLFIKKAPASTIETLASALIEIFNSNSKIREIGIRHGEKMHETLVTKEEMLKSENLGDHFRIKVDSRDLNYDKYFSKGDSKVDEQKEYNSSNTELLNKEKLIKILLKLPEVISELK
ncbi:MAG: UDP-glucose 4-epimerase [Pelagibacterales bacterium]|nr:UDP-glucose 4-epimerase [Pelagibacterales bacterium]|tara:strand:- start:672 stop:1679 length:1008 start_codon:yes stop_codon:yes gene_type:complete